MENLEQIYKQLSTSDDLSQIPSTVINYINIIGEYSKERKGVYTVLATLLYYKYLHPEQDVRLFQTRFTNGFSARSFDTKNVTPILTKLGLPAMSESGWLTRSLEQPYPYDLNYKGAIPTHLKKPFLYTLDFIEKQNKLKVAQIAYVCLKVLLRKAKEIADKNKIVIKKLKNPEKLTISRIISELTEQFQYKYNVQHGAKLPVLAFHSIYTILIKEMSRYKTCHLADLSSLTACDRTNKASGDIEIFNADNSLFEAIEIKLDKEIDAQIMRVVEGKIYKFNPIRYYVLSVEGIKESDRREIEGIVKKVSENHGCQIIINGLIPTIKYYLRLLTNLSDFIEIYSKEIEVDAELQLEHKEKWNELISKI